MFYRNSETIGQSLFSPIVVLNAFLLHCENFSHNAIKMIDSEILSSTSTFG